ncbi:MAG: ATP-grasp domain-containing protein [Candidatus Rifleibacteriota bacterium]
MNLVYLSPHYPAHFSQFVESLAKYGVKVLGISDLPDEALGGNLRSCLAGHYKVSHIENRDEVIRACYFFRDNHGSIDRVESHLEPWIEMEAEIREEFNVTGPKPDDLQFLKRKSKMKDIFTKAGVPVAKGTLVKDIDQCLDFINKNYPVFIKPDIGVGAADTYTIHNRKDLEDFFKIRQSYNYFMEEYVSGDIESFDGLTDKDGNIVFYTSHIFSNDIHNLVKNNENVWYYSVKKIPADLEKFGREVVKAAGIKEKFFHIEFFRLSDGSLKALEINMRPPGGLSTHMFNYACDVDVYDWWASIIADKDPRRNFKRTYHCGFVGRKHDRPYELSHDELYQKWGEKIVHSQPMNPIEYTVMGHWGYLPRTKDEKEMRKIIDDIVREA